MNKHNRRFAYTLLMAAGFAPALSVVASGDGTAVIRAESDAPGPAVSFVFKGVVSGSVAAGQSIRQGGLEAGAYTAWEVGGTPGQELVGIACDDDNSAGYVDTRTARFVVDGDEVVECVFTFRQSRVDDAPSSPAPQAPEDGAPSQAGPAPAAPQDEEPLPGPDTSDESEACVPPDLVPREGVWMVSNLPGTMICGPMTMPLTPSSEPGTLTLRDCGWTVVGSGFSDDTADLTMRASDQSGRRYTGTVGGARDGIPMTIHFEWQVQTDSRITGSLHSQVSQQGMTCVMSRDYEMRFTGNQ